MSKSKKYLLIKQLLTSVILALVGCASVVFTVLYLDTFESGFCYLYSNTLTAVSVSLISILTVLSITFLRCKKAIVYKILSLVIILIFLSVISLYVLKTTGFLDKFDSVEKFRLYIHSFGNGAVLLFILIQFLQVVVLPIPAFITVGAGVLLFGPFWGALYSSIGIITGSLVAFFIGRIFGFKVAKWLVGEDNLKKGLDTIKGKDKLILTFMFLFPFFPDDILCFVAGITTMSKSFFLVMIVATRIISIFASSYSMNNSIIPYNTWWGILIWILFFAFAFTIMLLLYKKGDAIENAIFKKKKKDSK